MTESFHSWPGKSPAGPANVAHPAVYHLLDAAAVAEILVKPWRLPAPIESTFVLLVGLHDLGKLGRPFRDMLERGIPQASGTHWEVSEAYFRYFDADICGDQLGGDEYIRYALYAGAAGHHGQPPFKDLLRGRRGAPTGDWRRMIDAASDVALRDAKYVLQTFLEFWPDATLQDLSEQDARQLSWRLAGLTTASDWIASNTTWFAPIEPGPDLSRYLSMARARAPDAVRQAGLMPPRVQTDALYDFALRDMQQACADAELPDGPMLAVIEDETGSGKTEAAMLLARRMLVAEKGRGLFLALPTMATADAMFGRVTELLPRLYDGPPSVALAHGRAAFSEAWQALRSGEANNPEEPGALRISDWVADNRRLALLATLGVGTVDQALLAVLRAKHAPLRQFGLSSKILIIDEVHEMGDPYMGRLLQTLLFVHAAHGGSAILLSATIPLKLRAQLVCAFEEGAGRPAPSLRDESYPALTIPRTSVRAITPVVNARGPLPVRRLESSEAAIDLLERAALEGAACVWVRNAVDEAIAAVKTLRTRGVNADLFHARFTLHDRKEHEATILGTYGKARAMRAGRVLVATQVVESSLDLDFDVMVSDLAPMAALIQRAGRLWRHMDLRPAASRPVPAAVLHVLSPDPKAIESENWLNATLGAGAFVYDTAIQWRTATMLFQAGQIEPPAGLRNLIERAHGDTIQIPVELARREMDELGRASGQTAHAQQNVIDWARGYRDGGACDDDSDYPTRLGVPQQVLILARRAGNLAEPWSGGDWTVEACQMSEVQASLTRLSKCLLPEQSDPLIKTVLDRLPKWIGRTRCVCLVGEKGRITEGLSYSPDDGLVFNE